ncbi:MAG: PQQ-like beta-propeller repeat protein [Acidobacteria bacterium]|nr:PQQ-like beta-propeller repeat protein [Acidobacteriota bacterium]
MNHQSICKSGGRWLLTAILSFSFFHSPLVAQDWPQWRGPTRDGVVPAKSFPSDFAFPGKKLWRVEIGEGYSSPVVSGGRAFVHSRRDAEEIVTAVDLVSGKMIWEGKYLAPFTKNQYASKMAKGPASTPLVAGKRLITFGITGIVSAWNTETGALLWRKDYSDSVDSSKLFTGTAASPLFENGAVIIQVGSDIHGGRLLALEPAIGAERWVWRGAGPGYASPSVITVGGVGQIVICTEGSLEGIDPKSGGTLWSVPFPDEWHENIMTPVWTGTHLIVSGPRQGTHAYTLKYIAGKWIATEAWKNADVAMYMSTPAFADGILYGHSTKKKGQLFALDAATGMLKWATAGREGENASVFLTPNHVMFLSNSAKMIWVRRSAEKYDEVGRSEIADSETWATPAPLPDGMIVRDATSVFRLVMSR